MAFDKDKPASSTSLRASNPEILANQEAIQDAIDNEHEFSGTAASTQDGYHTQGSARCFSQATAPATRIDGTSFDSTDLGSLWVDTDDNAFYLLTATTPTWTPVSTEVISTLLGSARVFTDTLGVTGDFAVNTDKFNVTATNGNTSVAGTLGVTGQTTLTGGLAAVTMAGAIAMGSNKITGASDATADGDVINLGQYTAGDGSALVSYTGQQSMTWPNGFTVKMGTESVAGNTADVVTFTDAFTGGVVVAFATWKRATPGINECCNALATTSQVTVVNDSTSGPHDIYWIVIGWNT